MIRLAVHKTSLETTVKSSFLRLIAAFVFAAPCVASATTIDTFSFTQSGYPGVRGGFVSVWGSFTGTVEYDGYIQLADLQSFTINFGPFVETGLPILFTYSTTAGDTTLDIESQATMTGNYFCIGAVAAYGFDHCNNFGLRPLGVWGNSLSFQAPVVTLVSSVTDTPPPPPFPSAVPEPASLLLMGTGLLFAGVRRFA
jgi:PEP-CTERM motif-containing protein